MVLMTFMIVFVISIIFNVFLKTEMCGGVFFWCCVVFHFMCQFVCSCFDNALWIFILELTIKLLHAF